MSVSDLKYKNKYLKYKNKYLNLQRQIGGVDNVPTVDVPKHSMQTISDDVQRLILNYPNISSFNKESKKIQDENTKTSLIQKLGITTLDGLFSTGDKIHIREQLNNREIYLLAKLFVSDIKNTRSLEFYYDIVITPPGQLRYNIVSLAPLKNALLNPTRPLFLTTNYGIKEEGYITFGIIGVNDPIDDDLIDFQLRFIFFCINIMDRPGNIAIKMDDDSQLIHLYPNPRENPFTNSFNTIILGLKMNIPIKILEYIDATLSDNFASIKALAEVLKTNTTLTELDLRRNFIGNEEAIVLAEALKINKTLVKLNLSENNIGNEGAKALAEALKTNRTLINLNLETNRISANGADPFVETLETNTTLIVEIFFNEFIDEDSRGFNEIIKRLSKLYPDSDSDSD